MYLHYLRDTRYIINISAIKLLDFKSLLRQRLNMFTCCVDRQSQTEKVPTEIYCPSDLLVFLNINIFYNKKTHFNCWVPQMKVWSVWRVCLAQWKRLSVSWLKDALHINLSLKTSQRPNLLLLHASYIYE